MSYVHQEYPRVMWRAVRDERGHATYEQSSEVPNEREERGMPSHWKHSPAEALAWLDKVDDELSTAAAERAYTDKRMSKKAQKEMAAKEALTGKHVAE